MTVWPLSFLLLFNVALAANLKVGKVVTTKTESTVLSPRPEVQLSLPKNSQVKILPDAVRFEKGILRIKITKSKAVQKVEADGVEFTSKDAEFEVSTDGANFDLAVVSGEVQVSSPYVQTFVPEIVKSHEGFRFNRKEKSFSRKPYLIKFSGHSGFAQKK